MQVAVVGTDLGSVFACIAYFCAFHIIHDSDEHVQSSIPRSFAVFLCMTCLLTNRWVFLGSLYDRRQAFTAPLEYKLVNQKRRVCKLVLHSFLVALLLCTIALWPSLEPVLQHRPLAEGTWALCQLYHLEDYPGWPADRPFCQGYTEYGFMWSRIGGPRWRLAYRTKPGLNSGFAPPDSILVLLGVATATDAAIGVLCFQLLERVRSHRQLQASLRRFPKSETDEGSKVETQKTVVLLSLCVIILLQLLTLAFSLTCNKVSDQLLKAGHAGTELGP